MIQHNAIIAEKTTWRFSVDDYIKLHQTRIIPADKQVELLDGEIIEITQIGPMHAYINSRLSDLIHEQLGSSVRLYLRKPLRLSTYSMPNPDLMVLQRKNYSHAYPESADLLLLIEVRQPPGSYDREEKLPLYATAGITEVWLIDPEQQIVEQYTASVENHYSVTTTHLLNQSITSANLPELKIALTEIFDTTEES